jgi:uncharacterized protein YjbI with pentapeptide repeats
MDLSNEDLSRADFSQANLCGANFEKSKRDGTRFKAITDAKTQVSAPLIVHYHEKPHRTIVR